ncbi:response regulator [Flavobacterium sp.]|uniref:response regulator n=1 Tax=Flavobacterium sp. TaxID=239 RepID=UPI0025BA0491|nr:response regulator [Flavobacterium sp.]
MIFYADDDADDLEFFQEIAADLDVEVMTFDNGLALIENLKRRPANPDFVFLDINMPLYNGLQILEMIRAEKLWDHIPVFMFTTSTMIEHIEKSMSSGATFYIPKSSDYNLFKESVRFAIEKDWNGFLPQKNTFVFKDSSMFGIPGCFSA